MKTMYKYIAVLFTVVFVCSCSEETKFPDAMDVTAEYKEKLTGEWIPVEQSVLYYVQSYVPGRDTVVTFKEPDLLNLESPYFNGLYGLKVLVSKKGDDSGELIKMKFEENQNFMFENIQLSGARFHVTQVDSNVLINFMKNESESSDVKQVERMPYTIISLSDKELIIGTKSDAQESVFTGEYNQTTGLPVSQNRWCTHTITYRKK